MDHRCTERCICPDHHTLMLWSKGEKMHACVDPECRYADGLEDKLYRHRYEPWLDTPVELKDSEPPDPAVWLP